MFSVGRRVKLQELNGTVAKTELNGTVAVILKPDSDKEKDSLAEKNRVKVSGFPRPLSLKIENIVLIDDALKTDWTFVDNEVLDCILSVTNNSRIGDIHPCHEYVSSVCQYIAQGSEIRKLHLDMFSTLFKGNIGNHSIYFGYFDQIGHHLIMETHHGKARVFQSFIRDEYYIGQNKVMTGYSAREWTSKKQKSHWSDQMKRTHSMYGGGRELSYTEWIDFVDLLYTLQAKTDEIANMRNSILPPQFIHEKDTFIENDQYVELELTNLQKFVNELAKNPYYIASMPIPETGDLLIYSTNCYDGEGFEFKIPGSLVIPFVTAFTQLTGQLVCTATYMKIFAYHNWRDTLVPNKVTGIPEPMGWVISANAIPH